uniref:Uncharacterized protein LOC111136632 n=1 Tax=Crassostrea virginica TaxID=6565 RepID=A0A8B8ETP0_CRAVI|nr:uncharacterized protein LOC111136632 [Crassostrea virginica]
MNATWNILLCFCLCLQGSFGHKYFILNRNVLGSIYIGNQDELIGSDVAITGNSVQTPSSPLLRPLKQDQFSFDMELCDIVTITKGSFIVAEMSTPQNGVLFQCFNKPAESRSIHEILTIMTTNTIYDQLFKNKVSMSS